MQEVLSPIGISADNPLADICEEIVIAASANDPGELLMRPGGWRINLGASAVRTLVATAIVGCALVAVGADQVPLQLLPVVLPVLVDVERIRLNRDERALIVPLREAAEGVEGLALHPQILYDRLDPTVQEQLNYYDFLAFIERLTEAGEVDDAGFDDVRVRPNSETAWIRISIR
jgi:hypothetical protein